MLIGGFHQPDVSTCFVETDLGYGVKGQFFFIETFEVSHLATLFCINSLGVILEGRGAGLRRRQVEGRRSSRGTIGNRDPIH